MSIKIFMRKLASGKRFQNWVTQKAPIVFKKKSEGRSSTKSWACYTENEWSNFNVYTITMEENEREKYDVK